MNEKQAELKLVAEVDRGKKAEAVLNNSEFKRAFKEYSVMLFDSFKRTDHTKDGKEKREEIYRQIKALDTVEAKLTESIQTGEMAIEQLSIIQKAVNALKI